MTVTGTGPVTGWLSVFLLGASSAILGATEPTVRNLSVRGLQVGGTTTLTIEGDDLTAAPRLLLPFPSKQVLKPGSTERLATFEVTLENTIPPGYAQLRIVTAGGASLPTVIGVDRLVQKPLTATVEQLPAALHGTVTGGTTVEARFAGKAGQKVMVEVEAQRLGSRLRPVVHLNTPKNLELAWAWMTPTLHDDARLEATLPEDGEYTVKLHDAEYAGQSPGFFRLKVGLWSYIDRVFPPVVGKGPQSVELIGPLTPLKADLPASSNPSLLPLSWPKEGLWSGPRPFVAVVSTPELIEQRADEKIQSLPAGAVGVSGRLLQSSEEDRYRIPVTPGARIRFEVVAERYGSPLDVALSLRNEMGEELARAEDSPGTLDPVLEYTVPDRVTAVVLAVVDAQGRGGPHGLYHLAVDPRLAANTPGDFRLHTPTLRLSIPVGGSALVPVQVERRGYQGSVVLSAEGLPAGVKLEGTTIPAGADGTLVTVRRSEAAGDAVLSSWKGRAENGQERPIVVRGHPLETIQPWIASEIAIAPTTAKAAEFVVDWRNLPAEATLTPAGKLALPVKVSRPATASLVRLSLVTSQLVPRVNNQPDPNQSLRAERPVELAAKATDGDFSVLIPAVLPSPVYDVAIQAELLSPDRAKVLATAFTPVRRLAVRLPVVVQLDGPARLEAQLDPKTGATLDLKGKVERFGGFAGDVALTLTGFPPGTRADAVTVKAGATAFTMKLILPANAQPGEFRGLKLVGTVAPDPRQSNVRVRSKELDVTLVVRAPAK